MKKFNPSHDVLRAKALASPTPDSILDEAIEKSSENERLRPKLRQVFRIVAASALNEIEAYVEEGFTREEALQIFCARVASK